MINSTYGGPAGCYTLYKYLQICPLYSLSSQELQYRFTGEKTEALGKEMFVWTALEIWVGLAPGLENGLSSQVWPCLGTFSSAAGPYTPLACHRAAEMDTSTENRDATCM